MTPNSRLIPALARTLFLLGSTAMNLSAQLTVPGRPMGDYRKASAEEAIYLLPPPDPLRIEASIQSGGSDYSKVFRFAIEREVDLSPRYNGTWTTEGDYRVWRLYIISPGAYSLGLIFRDFHLAAGVKLLAYDPAMNHIKGAYSEMNNKASGILAVGHNPGDEIILEMQVPGSMDDYGRLTLGSVSHAYADVNGLHSSGGCPGNYGCSGGCEVDVNCIEGSGWQKEKRSVIRVSTPGNYCTGVLINNTAYSGDPLILTAEHCIDSDVIAAATVFEFNYESPGCFAGEGSVQMSISGGELLALGDSLDFSLVRLSLAPPESFNAYYAGWDLSGSQPPGSTAIHHPEGDVKKISFDLDPPSQTAEPSDIPQDFREYLYDSFWWIRQWDTGSTEPGSSGSPLFNSNHRVIGLLSFGKAYCGDSIGYDSETERIKFSKDKNVDDYYTQLGVAWDHNPLAAKSLKSWLDPKASGATALGGYEPASTRPGRNQEKAAYSLFPNPAGQGFYVSSSTHSPERVRVEIYDLNGSLVLETSGSLPGAFRIETGLQSGGLYLVRITGAGGQEIHKMVIQ